MGEKCLKQYHTYPECYQTSKLITLSRFLNFPNLGCKYHLPKVQSPVYRPPPPRFEGKFVEPSYVQSVRFRFTNCNIGYNGK